MRRSTIALIAAGILACCLLFFFAGIFASFQHRLADSLYGGKPALSNIVIIGIDDKSLQEIGRWPWNRANFSVLLNNTGSPALVGIDIAFLEKSDPKADASLADACARRPVVLVSEYTGFSKDDEDVLGTGLLLPALNNDAAAKANETGNSSISDHSTYSTGYSNIVTDPDGVVRALNLDLGKEPAFSARLYEQFTRKEHEKNDRFLINYAGPPGTFTRYSASDVILGKVPSENFKGKIVLVGAVARDFHDDAIVPTSRGSPMPGVEVHANALQTMLLNDNLQTMPSWMVILLMSVVVAVMAFFVARFHIAVAGAVAAGIIVGYIALALFMFEKGWIFNLVYVPFTVAFSFTALSAAHLVHERQSKKRISDAFSKYVSPAVLDQILDSDVRLGGEQREITILFSDIRGFTTISESMSPEELVDLLNEYFEDATNAIMEHRGLVDKFIGDAIMAFWNAPLHDEHHADNAVIAALALSDIVKKFNEKKSAQSKSSDSKKRLHEINVGIGINTGEAVAGNIGSMQRLSYTAMGDSVNLASRLEGLTKEYGVTIIISEYAKKKLKQEYVLRELDRVKVKGKLHAVTIYEVVCSKAGEKTVSDIEDYEKGLHHYYAGEWSLAKKIFLARQDKASKLMLDRCLEFESNPPSHWDGTYTMEHK